MSDPGAVSVLRRRALGRVVEGLVGAALTVHAREPQIRRPCALRHLISDTLSTRSSGTGKDSTGVEIRTELDRWSTDFDLAGPEHVLPLRPLFVRERDVLALLGSVVMFPSELRWGGEGKNAGAGGEGVAFGGYSSQARLDLAAR